MTSTNKEDMRDRKGKEKRWGRSGMSIGETVFSYIIFTESNLYLFKGEKT